MVTTTAECDSQPYSDDERLASEFPTVDSLLASLASPVLRSLDQVGTSPKNVVKLIH